MKTYMMIPGFLILSGIACLWMRTLHLRFFEGVYLAVSTIIFLLFASGGIGTFTYGMVALFLLGTAGFIWNLVLEIKSHNLDWGWNIPAYRVLTLALLYAMLAFWKAPLQHVDEFHLWGAAVRFMERENRLVNWTELGIGGQYYAASFFQLFFQKLTGYNEQAMYAASFLMIWVGFLLPFSKAGRKQWKTVLLYSLLIFLSLYSLYLYPYKSLYTDLPAAAWAGGLAGWWMNRDKDRKKGNLLVLIVGLITLVFLKSYVGILMVFLLLLFVITERVRSDERFSSKKFRRTWLLIGCVFIVVLTAIVGAVLLLICRGSVPAVFPQTVRNFIEIAEPSLQKAVRVLGALANAWTGKNMGGTGRLDVYPCFFTLLIVTMIILSGWIRGDKLTARARVFHVISSSIIYLLFLAVSYICLFNYEEAIVARGVKRYFSILAIYQLIIALTAWFGEGDDTFLAGERQGKVLYNSEIRRKIMKAGALFLLLFVAWGVNDKFISSATAYNDYQIEGSADIEEANAEVKKVDREIGEAKVYFLNQDTDNEFPQNIAFYHLGSQVNNYLNTPWRFTEDGCEIRIQEYETPTLSDLPQILSAGGYQYLWIYDADEYLTENLGRVFHIDGSQTELTDGQLYQVIADESGTVAGLRLEGQLNPAAKPVDSNE